MSNRKKVIERYEGALTAAQVAAGMNAARRNATSLIDEATILLQAKRHARACALAILSIEESGKISLLRLIATAANQKHLKDAWRSYRDHKAKNVKWIVAELAAKGARKLDDLSPMFDPDSDPPLILDVVKQLGFYTDCYGKAHWSEPIEVIDEQLAQQMLSIAKVLLPKREASEREIQLWIKHLGGHFGTRATARGALNFEKAMIAEGLSTRTIEEVERFYDVENLEGVRTSLKDT